MTDEDEEADLDEPPLVGVEDYHDEADAHAAARLLVEQGIGATVERMVATDEDAVGGTGEPEPEPEPDAGADHEAESVAVDVGRRRAGEIFYRLLVLDHEERRALAVLGLAEPEYRPEPNPTEPMKPEKGQFPWKKVIPIYLLALVGIPALAFYLTYTIMH